MAERRRCASLLAWGVVQGSRSSVKVARQERRRRRSGGGSGADAVVVGSAVSWWWRWVRRRRPVVDMARHFFLDFSDTGAGTVSVVNQ